MNYVVKNEHHPLFHGFTINFNRLIKEKNTSKWYKGPYFYATFLDNTFPVILPECDLKTSFPIEPDDEQVIVINDYSLPYYLDLDLNDLTNPAFHTRC